MRALTDVELIVFAGNELHYLLADTKIASRVGHLMLVGPVATPHPRGDRWTEKRVVVVMSHGLVIVRCCRWRRSVWSGC